MPRGQGWGLEWPEKATVDFALGPVAKSAAELLCSDALARVRHCEMCLAAECDWVFLDTTKNRTRRWCEMKSCGNRAKARRHAERQRAVKSA